MKYNVRDQHGNWMRSPRKKGCRLDVQGLIPGALKLLNIRKRIH